MAATDFKYNSLVRPLSPLPQLTYIEILKNAHYNV